MGHHPSYGFGLVSGVISASGTRRAT